MATAVARAALRPCLLIRPALYWPLVDAIFGQLMHTGGAVVPLL